MKKLYSFLILLVCATSIFAQVPGGFSYQAAIRDNNGNLYSNKSVNLRFSILQNDIEGESVYSELWQTTTNDFGVLTLEIGNGTPEFGVFSEIDWSEGSYFLKSEIDLDASGNYTLSGTTQLLSVPFAMYAEHAGKGETDLNAMLQRIKRLEASSGSGGGGAGTNVDPQCSINGLPSETFLGDQQYTISVSASDSDGSIANVKLYVDDVLFASDSQAPYEFVIPENKLAEGTHTIKAVATDNRNGSSMDEKTVTYWTNYIQYGTTIAHIDYADCQITHSYAVDPAYRCTRFIRFFEDNNTFRMGVVSTALTSMELEEGTFAYSSAYNKSAYSMAVFSGVTYNSNVGTLVVSKNITNGDYDMRFDGTINNQSLKVRYIGDVPTSSVTN